MIAILANENCNDHRHWLEACEKMKDQILYKTIDLTRGDWLGNIIDFGPDILLAKPGGLTAPFKQLYDERLLILVKELGLNCYPTLDEILIYENKRYFSYWLKANKIPHPETRVFYFQDEAISFLSSAVYPVVGKVNIGASGSGVTLLHDQKEALDYVRRSFSEKGSPKRWGPNLGKGNWLQRGLHYVLHPGDIEKKRSKYRTIRSDKQKGFVLLQEYIPHDFEWRIVVIGDSYFAHKKLKIGEKASGSLLKKYDNPPIRLFDFAKEIMDRFGFFSQAIDVFEKNDGSFLVNEMQCIFGQSDPYQMLVNGRPGRFVHQGGKWRFEEGDFNTNESYDLRLKTAINLFNNGR
ncbi:MAG: hypothetical protein JW786_12515 [Desulfobacterales bacterium]|nr:hypothetical protein [Desulfobacterales bacterium]